MQQIVFNEKKLAFKVTGTGIPVVFLHSFCTDSRMWDEFIPFFSKYKIIQIDLPGFGKSPRQEHPSIADMADGVQAVLQHLKIEKCVMIGHSMGGYVTMEFAKKYSDTLLGLGLFHSHPFADTEEKKEDRQKGIDFIRRNGHIHYVKQVIPTLFASNFSKGYTFELNSLIYNAVAYQPEGIIAALEAMSNRTDTSEVLTKIDCPVLFIIGKEDAAVPLEVSLEMTHLPNIADFHILSNVGHMGMFEAQRETVKIVKEFLKRI